MIRQGKSSEPTPIEVLIVLWQAQLKSPILGEPLAASTERCYTLGATRFAAWCRAEERRWDQTHAVEDWKRALLDAGYRPGSVNTWLAGVKAFFAWASATRLEVDDPTQGIASASRRAGERSRVALTEGEVVRVLAQPDASCAGKRDRAILSLIAHAAARLTDVQRTSLGDLIRSESEPMQLALASATGDRPASQLIVLHTDTARSLEAWLAVHPGPQEQKTPLFVSLGNRSRGRRLTVRAIRRIVRSHLESANIRHPQKTPQSLRGRASSGGRIEGEGDDRE